MAAARTEAETNQDNPRQMIRHIVFFSVPDQGNMDAVMDGLRILQSIEHASVLEVIRNSKVDPWSDEIDIVVYGEFKDAEALAAYKADPKYRESIGLVRHLRGLRISADFEATARS